MDDEEISEIHMLMYLYSYEWGSSLIDKDEFLNSIRVSSDVARNTFYRELPEVIISRSGRITKVFWMHFLRLDLIGIVLLRFGEVHLI